MSNAPTLLAGDLAFVTGAGQGNGQAIAIGLARHGATVIATDMDAASAEDTAVAIRASGGEAHAYPLDVTDSAACRALTAETEKAHGPVSILINNAGILVRGLITDDNADEAWRRTMDVNLDGVYAVTKACLNQLKKTKGRIVNIASVQVYVHAPRNSMAYSVSKAGVGLLTKALALELAEDGVRVNALAPGMIATAMSAVTRADPARLANYLKHVPMNRPGEPEELVGPVVFLASEMSSYVTGAILPVDGGYLTM
jgi:NAD(P)-dependent dehydrogenase (short-subunit alcohol dehydrogenase family)